MPLIFNNRKRSTTDPNLDNPFDYPDEGSIPESTRVNTNQMFTGQQFQDLFGPTVASEEPSPDIPEVNGLVDPEVQQLAGQIFGYDIPERPAPISRQDLSERPAPISRQDLPAMPEYQAPPELQQLMQLMLMQSQPVPEDPYTRLTRQAAAIASKDPLAAIHRMTEKKRAEHEQRTQLMKQQIMQFAGMRAKSAEQEAGREYEQDLFRRKEDIGILEGQKAAEQARYGEDVSLVEAKRADEIAQRNDVITERKFEADQRTQIAEERRKEEAAIRKEIRSNNAKIQAQYLKDKAAADKISEYTGSKDINQFYGNWKKLLGLSGADDKDMTVDELFEPAFNAKKGPVFSKEYQHFTGIPTYTLSEDLMSLQRIQDDSTTEDWNEALAIARESYNRFINKGGEMFMLYPESLDGLDLLEADYGE